MQNDSLIALYFTAVRKMHHGEAQIESALPALVDNVADDDLHDALGNHLVTVGQQRSRLGRILESETKSAANLRNLGIQALIEEANAVVGAYDAGEVQDAGVTAVIQHIAHYKIACYGSLSTYAKMLDRSSELDELLKTRDDESGLDSRLTDIAKRIVNVNARSAASA